MGTNENKNIAIYSSVSDIPMYNFDKVRTLDDYNWMMVDYTGYNVVEVPDSAAEIYYDILNDYCVIVEDRTAQEFYELEIEISHIETRIIIVDGLIETYMRIDHNDPDPLLKELAAWGLVLSDKDDVEKQMVVIGLFRRAWLGKALRKNARLEEIGEEEKEGGASLISQKLLVENALDRNYIDLKKISAEEWAMLVKLAIGIQKEKRKWQAKT